MKLFLNILFVLITAQSTPLIAETGTSGAAILTRPLGSRSCAMGRAFTAIYGDPENVMYNPAGLNSNSKSIYFSYMNGLAGGGYSFSSFVFRINKLTVSPSFTTFNSSKIDLNLSDGTTGSVTAESDKVFMLSAAYEISNSFTAGTSLKLTRIELAETASASVINYDIGAIYKLTERFSVGSSILNNGKGIKFEDVEDKSPKIFRLGTAYKIELNPPNLLDRSVDLTYSDIILTLDMEKQRDEKNKYQAGFEMNMQMPYDVFMSLRAGWLFNREDEGITFGFSVKGTKWTFGLGFESSKEFESKRIFSISYQI